MPLSHDPYHISFLESVGANESSGDLSAEDNEGRAVHESVLHWRDDVGGSWARSDQDNAVSELVPIALHSSGNDTHPGLPEALA